MDRSKLTSPTTWEMLSPTRSTLNTGTPSTLAHRRTQALSRSSTLFRKPGAMATPVTEPWPHFYVDNEKPPCTLSPAAGVSLFCGVQGVRVELIPTRDHLLLVVVGRPGCGGTDPTEG